MTSYFCSTCQLFFGPLMIAPTKVAPSRAGSSVMTTSRVKIPGRDPRPEMMVHQSHHPGRGRSARDVKAFHETNLLKPDDDDIALMVAYRPILAHTVSECYNNSTSFAGTPKGANPHRIGPLRGTHSVVSPGITQVGMWLGRADPCAANHRNRQGYHNDNNRHHHDLLRFDANQACPR